MKKTCTKCKKSKSLKDFSKRNNYNKTNKVYIKSECKECFVVRTNKWVKKNIEKYNKYQNEYNKKLKERTKQKARYLSHVRSQNKAFGNEDIIIKEASKKWEEANKEK